MMLYIDNVPLRNDYTNVSIVNTKSQLDGTNQLLIASRGITFYLNQFKNVMAMGKQVITFTQDTNKMIRYLYNLVKSFYGNCDYFICTYKLTSYEPINDTNLSALITRLSREYFGKPYSINDYRHIYESYIQSQPNYMNTKLDDREKLHKKALHGSAAALKYKIIN